MSVCGRLTRFVSYDLWNVAVCFQPPSLGIEKVWVPVIWAGRLESGQDARIMRTDFSAAFARVNHREIYLLALRCAFWRYCVVSSDAVLSN